MYVYGSEQQQKSFLATIKDIMNETMQSFHKANSFNTLLATNFILQKEKENKERNA